MSGAKRMHAFAVVLQPSQHTQIRANDRMYDSGKMLQQDQQKDDSAGCGTQQTPWTEQPEVRLHLLLNTEQQVCGRAPVHCRVDALPLLTAAPLEAGHLDCRHDWLTVHSRTSRGPPGLICAL